MVALSTARLYKSHSQGSLEIFHLALPHKKISRTSLWHCFCCVLLRSRIGYLKIHCTRIDKAEAEALKDKEAFLSHCITGASFIHRGYNRSNIFKPLKGSLESGRLRVLTAKSAGNQASNFRCQLWAIGNLKFEFICVESCPMKKEIE